MSFQPVLHTLPGQTQTQMILALADFIGFSLDLRIVKKNNIKEKIYKRALQKKFPMLEIQKESFILGTESILLFIARKIKSEIVCDAQDKQTSQNDQLLDIILNKLLPALNVVNYQERQIIEPLKKNDLNLVKKDCQSSIANLDKIFANLENNSILISDFVFLVALGSTTDNQIKQQVKKMKNIQNRIKYLKEQKQFASANANLLLRNL